MTLENDREYHMRKEWTFMVNEHMIKVVNTWFSGIKLYVDGDLRDFDSSFFSMGRTALLSANLDEKGILEVNPKSDLLTVEIDAYLINNPLGNKKGDTQCVFSSYKRLSLKEQRLAKE